MLLMHFFIFELSEWVRITAFVRLLTVFFGTILVEQLIASFFFERIPLLFKLSLKLSFLDWIQWIQGVLRWHPCFFRAPI